ncbi:MAG: CBS domain-containing protein [Candidatus Omnitrophota bacterium]
MLKASIEDIMSEHIVTIPSDETVKQAAHLLLRFRINGILLVDRKDKNKLMGVFTTTDLLNLLHNAMSIGGGRMNELERIANMPVAKVATSEVIAVQKDVKIERLISIMHKKNVHTIPVYDKDKLLGVVGRHDVLNAAFA